MSDTVRNLEPKSLWNHFSDLNAVPRPSKKEERVIAFMKSFGESLGLETKVDHIGNVIITKPASPGREKDTTVVLQSHLDMVHQKNNDTKFDFDREGIRMTVDGDWVKADGTTLGADNGIGVASIMAILSSKTISHPPLEALFTIDEETGMTGAMELQGGLLDASIMLNLDTEDDNELTIGCAGGIDVTATGTYKEVACPNDLVGRKLSVSGLNGGHSGMDIHKGLGNANKIMNRILLAAEEYGIRISGIDGGGLRNAIPRESHSWVAIPAHNAEEFDELLGDLGGVIVSEYSTTDPDLELSSEECDAPDMVMEEAFQAKVLRAIQASPNGIYRMSPDVEGLVQTSNNLARVLIEGGEYKIACLTRSSVDSEKMDEAFTIKSVFELIGADVEFSGDYPGWTPRPESKIVSLMRDIYVERFKEQPHVNACHAGLECGILGTNYPEMEMISFGPNIRGAHSPDEKVQISSVQKYWGFLLETLEKLN
ncbi:MAG: aminoacyl-histidine dipeptidase [Bacteroidetes bacterium]|jgi:dipeptidase D|nr:aminoacyl-histidine dipeptidase [Bacteroidota bacterium]